MTRETGLVTGVRDVIMSDVICETSKSHEGLLLAT